MSVTLLPDPRAALAIVPFQAWPRDSSLAETLASGVARDLSGLATWLSVTAVAATISGPADLRHLRKTRRVRFVLHGSVEAERNVVRLLVELNEAETGRVLWSNRFDGARERLASLHDSAISRIAEVVPQTIHQWEQDRLALVPVEARTPHELALCAFARIMRPVRPHFAAARDLLALAEARGGAESSIWLTRAWWHVMNLAQGWSEDDPAELAAATSAIRQANDDDPAVRALTAWLGVLGRGDLSGALALLEEVLEAAPLCSLACSLKALVLVGQNAFDDALLYAERAEVLAVLGPERAWRAQVMAFCHYLCGQYAAAARWARASAAHHPGLVDTMCVLAASLVMLGRLDEATRAAQQVMNIQPGFRISGWQRRLVLPEAAQAHYAQRLRLAGLPA
ncbi:MAG TPA: hypothetical protein VE690_24230 [Rhodopila sp.]|nr:hypothetical protein [Rhodopila sp.]